MKRSILSMLLSLVLPVCMAHIPASKQYVDSQFSRMQSQIDVINTYPAISHPVGSCYGGGVVFYTNPDPNAPSKQRGLIAALQDTDVAWNTTSPVLNLSLKATYFTGNENTNAILSTYLTTANAAIAASNYFTPDSCVNCTPWYLPALDELMVLYTQSNSSIALGKGFWTDCGGVAPLSITGDNFYWTSTQTAQNPTQTSMVVDFFDGRVSGGAITVVHHVRAIRAF